MEGVLNVKEVPDHVPSRWSPTTNAASPARSWSTPGSRRPASATGTTIARSTTSEGEYGGYLPPRDVIHWLIDTVSKNGTFVLNIPGKPDGTIDSKEIAVLDRITAWTSVNGEAIYETRPWKIYGEGPNAVKAGSFQGDSVSKLGEKDIRFTRSKDSKVIFAIALGWPAGEVVVQSLGTASAQAPGKVERVELLGTGEKVRWRQAADGLHVTLPAGYKPAVDYAAALKVSL